MQYTPHSHHHGTQNTRNYRFFLAGRMYEKKRKKEKKEERKRRKGNTRPTVPLIFYVQPFLSVAPEINFVTGLLNVWV